MHTRYRRIARTGLVLLLLGTASATALPAGSGVAGAATHVLSPPAKRPTPTPTRTATAVPTNTPPNTPAPTNTPPNTPVPPTPTPTSSDPVVMAAGDIACSPSDVNYNNGNGNGTYCMQLATSNLLTTTVPVLPLGDDQYNNATLANFQTVYDPSWGRYKANTHPASGNHEYQDPGAAGYYSYFGTAAGDPTKGYYSYDLGTWHLIVLNSECTQVGGCAAGSPQEQWLKADLAAHANQCTLAYWHRALFSSGGSLGDSAVHDLWVDLYNAKADLVLNGHDHIYERFAPQDPAGASDPTNGVTEMIVGTGGMSHGTLNSAVANSVVRDHSTYGVFQLTLHPTSFNWQFLRATFSGNGTFTDSGSRACH